MTTNFPSSFWTWMKSFKNSTPGKVACIWHIEGVQIRLSLKERKFIFSLTVSPPSSSSLLKVTNDDDGGGGSGIGSRAVNNDDDDDDDQHCRSAYDI